MKTFVKHILKIVLILVVSAYVLEFCYTYVYKSSSPRTKFQYLRLQKNKNFDYVFLGSSRVENSIVSNVVESRTGKKTINLAFQGSNLADIYFVLQLFQDYNIKCKKVFIQIDEAFYTPNDYSKVVKYETVGFINENETISNYCFFTGKNEFCKNKNIPFYRYSQVASKIGFREFMSNILNIKKNDFISDKGYVPLLGKFKASKLVFCKPINKNIFFNLIENYNKKNNIEMVCYTAPYRISNNHDLTYLKNLSGMVPDLYNFSNLLQDNKYFQDNYHLNHDGAMAFTNILIEKLNL